MLFARTEVRSGAASLTLHVGAAEEIFVAAVKRLGGVYDTRVFGASSPLLPEGQVLFLILEGDIAWHPTGETTEAPAQAVIDLPVFEGFAGERGATFRTEGDTFRALEIRVPSRVAPALAAPRRLDDAALLESAERYHAGAHGDATHDEMLAAARALVIDLHRVGLLTVDLSEVVARPDAPQLRAIWEGLSSMLEQAGLGATLAMFADQANLSERQANRDVGAIFERLGFTYAGWRDAANRWRLRAATLLLSGSDSVVEHVARAVGFSGSNALGLAFRRAGMQSPGRVRAMLRTRTSPWDRSSGR